MKVYIFIIFFSLNFAMYGQRNQEILLVDKLVLDSKNDSENVVKITKFLLNNEFYSQGLELKLLQKNSSLIGTHWCFQWQYHHLPLYQKYIKINISNSNQILSIFNNLVSFQLDASLFNMGANCLYEINGKFVPAIKITENYIEQIYSSDSLLYEYDLASYYKDTSVLNHVFNPDPVTTANTVYGGKLSDSNDIHYPFIDSLYTLTQIPLSVSYDTLFFENEFVKIYSGNDASVSADYILLNNLNLYNRSEKAFEAMNCLYHIYNFHKYIQSIGIKNLATYQLPVNPHARPDDQSLFVPNTLLFGDGFVDDAEDAEVVIHEYGHALIESASKGTNIGFERKALDEGSCDYLATGYTKNISPYNWGKVFPWDGHNKLSDTSKLGWDGRVINSNKLYPFDISSNSIHKSGEIWSSCLIEIANDIGREQMDKILLTSYYSASANISYSQFAQLLLQADSLLYHGMYQYNLCKYLSKRGILNGQCYNSVSQQNQPLPQFIYIGDEVYIENELQELLNINIYTIDGKVLSFKKSNETFIKLDQNISEGVYIIKINNSNKEYVNKWVNLHP